MPNNYSITVTIASGQVTVDPSQLSVQADSVGDVVVVTWSPGSDTVITSITGFPSNVTITGPDEEGAWSASYTAASLTSEWTYFISGYTGSLGRPSHTIVHDPEINNTPPIP